MKAKPIKDYFNQHSRVAVLLISTIFTLMLGFFLLTEISNNSEQLINHQLKVTAFESKDIKEFEASIKNMEFYKNVEVSIINRTKGLIKKPQAETSVIYINEHSYIVKYRNVYFALILQKFLIVVLFSITGAYWVLTIFNKAKVNDLSKQVGQLFSSVENLSNKKSKVVKSEVSEFQEIHELLKDVDHEISTERVALINEAEQDHLTKIFNRKAFDRKIKYLEKRALSHQKSIGLLYFDLNDFKQMNDTYGHEFGDEILIKFANKLKENIRGEDLAFRLGGDEFAVIVQYRVDVDEDVEDTLLFKINNLRDQLISRVNKNVNVNGINIPLSCSIGLALYPYNVDKIGGLMHFADTDMYEHKKTTKARSRVTPIIKAV